MAALLVILGAVILTVTAVDVVWTVLAAGAGAGPLTSRLSALAWRVALRIGRRADGPRHQFLAVVGVAIMVGMLLSWVAVAATAWWVMSSAEGAVQVAADGRPAGLLERGYFVGYNLFTLGTNTYIAGDGLWQLLPIAIGASGLVFLTLGISYLVPVASAVAERRQVAQYMFSLGDTPDGILTRAWTGSGFGALGPHLVALAPMVHLAAERRLTYPALAFMHSAREQASTSVSLVVLDDAMTLLRQAVVGPSGVDATSVEAVRHAVGTFLESAGDTLVAKGAEPLPPPRLDGLRAAGIPTVTDAVFAEAMAADAERRRRLWALLAHDGWSSSAWARR